VAQRKFDEGDIDNNIITISNADVLGENLPDIRDQIDEPLRVREAF
jgi:hypothetical protein